MWHARSRFMKARTIFRALAAPTPPLRVLIMRPESSRVLCNASAAVPSPERYRVGEYPSFGGPPTMLPSTNVALDDETYSFAMRRVVEGETALQSAKVKP